MGEGVGRTRGDGGMEPVERNRDTIGDTAIRYIFLYIVNRIFNFVQAQNVKGTYRLRNENSQKKGNRYIWERFVVAFTKGFPIFATLYTVKKY